MLTEVLAHLEAAFAAAGIPAAVDARDLNLPGIWITTDTAALDTLGGNEGTVTAALVLVAADSGMPSSLQQLDELIDKLLDTPHCPRNWEAVSIRLPNHGPDPLPALRGTTTLDWSRS